MTPYGRFQPDHTRPIESPRRITAPTTRRRRHPLPRRREHGAVRNLRRFQILRALNLLPRRDGAREIFLSRRRRDDAVVRSNIRRHVGRLLHAFERLERPLVSPLPRTRLCTRYTPRYPPLPPRSPPRTPLERLSRSHICPPRSPTHCTRTYPASRRLRLVSIETPRAPPANPWRVRTCKSPRSTNHSHA